MQTNHHLKVIAVVAVTISIVTFELLPERSILSIPVKQAEEHNIAVPASSGFSVLLMQKPEVERQIAASEEGYRRDKSRILILDDEPDITFAFEKALRDRGFDRVDTANDPLIALKNFKPGSYDLLVIDIVMPQIDGFGLYEEIRKIDAKVKVCFITAFEINYQALRAVFPAAATTDDIGCFIRKPVDADELVSHIEAELN
jgi:CheY-like chemotaxis protein